MQTPSLKPSRVQAPFLGVAYFMVFQGIQQQCIFLFIYRGVSMYKSHSSTCYCLCVFVKTGIQTVEFGVNVCYDLFQQLLPWMTIIKYMGKKGITKWKFINDSESKVFLPKI